MPPMPRTTAVTAVLLLGAVADAGAAGRVSVADPGGGARWTATQSVGSDGRTCISVKRGRLSKGTTCAKLGTRTVYSYVVRNDRAPRPRDVRTVFIIGLAPNVVRASLQAPDRARTYRRRRGRPRVLLAVLAGRVERPTLSVDVRGSDGILRLVEGPPPAVWFRRQSSDRRQRIYVAAALRQPAGSCPDSSGREGPAPA